MEVVYPDTTKSMALLSPDRYAPGSFLARGFRAQGNYRVTAGCMAGDLLLPANKCFLDIIGYSLKRGECRIKGGLALGEGTQIGGVPE